MKRKIELVLFIILIFVLISVAYLKFFKKVNNINILGYSFFIVKTGSMEPSINMGELIIVKEKSNYNRGDIITYYDGNIFVTHRIVEISDNSYFTKGDANNERDIGISEDNIIGNVIYHSAFLGKIITDYLHIIIITYVIINLTIYFLKKIMAIN